MTTHTTHLLLRLGLAVAFIYPAVSAWFNPYTWIGYFPGFMLDIVGSNDLVLLHAFGLLEIAIGVWFLYGKKLLIPSAVATLMLAAIILMHWRQMDVIFRDIPIALMSLALVFDSLRRSEY